jgi:ferredoxin
MRKPKVDQTLCTGAEVCAIIAPDVFEMNEEGKAYVVDPEGADEETIQRAIDQCPSKAIFWVEEG